jgi:hypothetical protein
MQPKPTNATNGYAHTGILSKEKKYTKHSDIAEFMDLSFKMIGY